VVAYAEGTRTWEQSKFEELIKGTAKGVAIRSAGGLELAPSLKTLYTSPSTYIWAVAADKAGNLYAASGAPARVYRLTSTGQASVIFEPPELQVQALLVTRSGTLLAATAPDGKVYKIEPSEPAKAPAAKPAQNVGSSAGQPAPAPLNQTVTDTTWHESVFFDPGTKYIWDLVEDASGNVYVATGDHGEIYKVTPKGEHSLFFKSDEVHIRVIALDPKGNLIAGSDGSGLVYRIAPDGNAFVLYSAPKKEITALAVDGDGNIYAAGAGEKRTGAAPASMQVILSTPAAAAPVNITPQGATGQQSSNPAPVVTSVAAPGGGSPVGSDIYRIAPDGSPARMWTSREDLVYALAFDGHGRLLAGTGNRGHVFAITGDNEFSDLLRVAATQITGFAEAPGGGLYVSTSNFGKIFELGPATDAEGTYESDVFDARIFSRWGRAEFRGAGSVALFARSGNVDNPDRNWSPWTAVDWPKDPTLAIPPARFVQWKAILHAGDPAPRVDSVLLNYLPRNVAPQVDEITVQVGVRYLPGPKPTSESSASRFDSPPPSTRDRDSIGVKWTAHDDNDDQMTYSLYYRGEGQSRWLLLRDDITDKYASFDASLLPDGGYTVKVVASDAPSHSPGEALSSEKESARFEVDTTPPRVEGLGAAMEEDQVHVHFSATDGFSPIKRAEYSVDAGDWQVVEPVGQISDAKTETYDFKVAVPAEEQTSASPQSTPESKLKPAGENKPAGAAKKDRRAPADIEHVVVVRVWDRYDNQSSAKTVVPARRASIPVEGGAKRP
jgi:hypothetical protein